MFSKKNLTNWHNQKKSLNHLFNKKTNQNKGRKPQRGRKMHTDYKNMRLIVHKKTESDTYNVYGLVHKNYRLIDLATDEAFEKHNSNFCEMKKIASDRGLDVIDRNNITQNDLDTWIKLAQTEVTPEDHANKNTTPCYARELIETMVRLQILDLAPDTPKEMEDMAEKISKMPEVYNLSFWNKSGKPRYYINIKGCNQKFNGDKT
jgi:hypothetical protein